MALLLNFSKKEKALKKSHQSAEHGNFQLCNSKLPHNVELQNKLSSQVMSLEACMAAPQVRWFQYILGHLKFCFCYLLHNRKKKDYSKLSENYLSLYDSLAGERCLKKYYSKEKTPIYKVFLALLTFFKRCFGINIFLSGMLKSFKRIKFLDTLKCIQLILEVSLLLFFLCKLSTQS